MEDYYHRSTAPELLDAYRKLQAIRRGHWADGLLRPPQHQRHYEQYTLIERIIRRNPEAWYELLFSGELADHEIGDFFNMIFGGSISKKDNLHLVAIMERVRNRKGELPQSLQSLLDWLEEVHEY